MKSLNYALPLLAAGLTWVVAGTAHAQNLVQNYNFAVAYVPGSTPPALLTPGNYDGFSAGSTGIADFTVDSSGSPLSYDGGGGVSWIGADYVSTTYSFPGSPTPGGNNVPGGPINTAGTGVAGAVVVLDNTGAGGIHQYINTVVGDIYSFNLYFAVNSNSLTSTATGEVTFGTSTALIAATAGSFQTFVAPVLFTATSTSTLVDITQTSLGSNNLVIADLDAQLVSGPVVPEPSETLLLLVSGAVLAFFVRRRRLNA